MSKFTLFIKLDKIIILLLSLSFFADLSALSPDDHEFSLTMDEFPAHNPRNFLPPSSSDNDQALIYPDLLEGFKHLDLDGLRLLFLASFDEHSYAVPKKLLDTLRLPEGKSRKLSHYSAVVIGTISGFGALTLVYSGMLAPECNSGIWWSCGMMNSAVPIFLGCVSSCLANIGGQWIYDRRLNRYEGLRNKAQDSNHLLQEIYENILKFAARAYVNNLLLVYENIPNEDVNTLFNLDPRNAGWEENLDQYLDSVPVLFECQDDAVSLEMNIPVKFRPFLDMLKNWPAIHQNLTTLGVEPQTLEAISKPFNELSLLLLKPEGRTARQAIFSLTFKGEKKPNTVSLLIYEIIQTEDIANIFKPLAQIRAPLLGINE